MIAIIVHIMYYTCMAEKTSEVIRTIRKAAKVQGMDFVPRRPGGRHIIYDLDGLTIPMTCGTTTNRKRQIFKECEPKLGRGWWR